MRPVAWFRFFTAAESVAATLRLGSGCKVVMLPFPHSYTDLPGGVIPGAARLQWRCGLELAKATIVCATLLLTAARTADLTPLALLPASRTALLQTVPVSGSFWFAYQTHCFNCHSCLHFFAGPLPDKEPQQAAGSVDASGSPAATAADSQPMAMSQPAEVNGAEAPGSEAAAAAAPASSADDAAEATPMSQLPDAADTEEVGQGLDLVPTAGSAVQELLDPNVDAVDGFHLEDFQVRFGAPTGYVQTQSRAPALLRVYIRIGVCLDFDT